MRNCGLFNMCVIAFHTDFFFFPSRPINPEQAFHCNACSAVRTLSAIRDDVSKIEKDLIAGVHRTDNSKTKLFIENHEVCRSLNTAIRNTSSCHYRFTPAFSNRSDCIAALKLGQTEFFSVMHSSVSFWSTSLARLSICSLIVPFFLVVFSTCEHI